MEEKALSSLGTAQKKIKLEIQDLSERVKLARESTQKLKEQIEQAESTDNGWLAMTSCDHTSYIGILICSSLSD